MFSKFPQGLLRTLLRFYPQRVRQMRGEEVKHLYREMWNEMQPRGLTAMGFRARMAVDLLRNAGAAWVVGAKGLRKPEFRGPSGGFEKAAIVLAEVKVAVRRLLRTPGFTVVAIVTLALGIAANTVVFTLIQGVYLKPLPYLESDRIVHVQEAAGDLRLGTAYDAYRYFAEGTSSFEDLGAYSGASVILREGEYPVRLNATRVSANFFSILGLQPASGRGFLPEEDEPGADPVVVLSHSTWQNRFAGRHDIVGSQIRMGSGTYSVVGIMPPDFHFPNETIECWITMSGQVRDPTYRSLAMVGRLSPGVSMERAGEDVMSVGLRLLEENEAAKGGDSTRVYSLKDRLVGSQYKATFLALAVAVGFLLLIAGANLANLLLARASTRQVEVAVRSALGASWKRAVLTGITEPLVLSMASGLLGVLVAYWATEVVLGIGAVGLPRRAEIGVEASVVAFALGLSALAGLFIGLASLFPKNRDGVVVGVHSGGRVSRGQPMLSLFTITQVALTFALLAGASLMGKTVQNLQRVDVGFEPDEAYVINLGLPSSQYPDAAARLAFHDRVIHEARSLPWVSAAGYTSLMPLDGGWSDTGVLLEGAVMDPDNAPTAEYDLATPGFFAAMGISLRGGRVFDESDARGAPLVAVINEALARAHFSNAPPVGRRLAMWNSEDEEPQWLTVVGVVENVHHHGIVEPPTPKLYVPFAQFQEMWPYGLNLVIRSSGAGIQGISSSVREFVGGLSTGNPLVEIEPLGMRVDRILDGPRFNTLLLGIFTFAALGLAALGLYGVVAFGVSERRKEIGLRMAMGADRMRIQKEVLARGLRLTLVGILAGVPLALLMGRVLGTMLFGVESFDSGLLAWVTVLLAVVATAACVLPSLRASRIPPATALRSD